MIETVIGVLIILYFLQIVFLIVGITKRFPTLKENQLPSATIIVAARNEENNILQCLSSLNEVVYPDGKLEIVIVDDNSTDNTSNIIDEYIKDKPIFKKIKTNKEIGRLKGKTNALANALAIANGEIILTTDADCFVKPTWAKTIASYFTENVALVSGFTTQKADNNFNGMQALDFIYLQLIGAGTINMNYPISCIGNNMAYLKKVYNEVGGYETLPFSVTEDFVLLYSIYKLDKYKIIHPFNQDSLVTSEPCCDVKTVLHQKKRWGVGGLDVPIYAWIVGVLGFLTNVSFLILPFVFTLNLLGILLLKLFIDYLFLYFSHDLLGIKKNLKYFLIFEGYYILYSIWLPIAVITSRKVLWKGRNY